MALKPQKQGGPVSGALTSKGFRLDIQGVRGLALVLVLLCHAEMPFAAGGYVGLDIFYVLSGFLITGLIVGEVERTGRLSVRDFYARRAKRLLPLAVTVLAVIVVGSAVLFSPLRAQEVSGDVVAAALYFVNWRFISQSVDYFAFDDLGVSPVQHYWSLSVEEQFYFMWPLLVLGGAIFARRAGLGLRPSLALFIVPIAIASLAYSIWFTPQDPQAGYFSTLTRIWELAAGAILALALPVGMRLPKLLTGTLAALGIAVLLGTTFAFSGETHYPGWRGLLPVLATAAIIVAGTAEAASRPIRLLSTAPFQYLGKISYAWYLWHWPVIVFALAIWERLTPLALLGLTALAWIPAAISHYTIEERFRRSRTLGKRPRRALALGATCTVAAIFLGFGLQTQTSVPTASEAAARGAMAVGPVGFAQQAATSVRPPLDKAAGDKGPFWDDGCVLLKNDTDSPECARGVVDSDKTVVVFGDSHALQWTPTLLELAKEHRWRLVGLMRAGCVVSQVPYERPCNVWRRKAMKRIIRRERPDLVVISSSTGARYKIWNKGRRLGRKASEPLLRRGFARTLRRLKRSGSRVVVIRDQALAPFNPPECVSRYLHALDRCAFKPKRLRSRAFDAFGTKRVKGVRLIDPLRVLCPRFRVCRSVIGNVLVYRDTYHLSATFARTLAPWLERKLRPLP